jgi:hypothetical protein
MKHLYNDLFGLPGLPRFVRPVLRIGEFTPGRVGSGTALIVSSVPASAQRAGCAMRAANLLVAEFVPDVPGEVPAFGFSRQKSLIHLDRHLEIPVEIAGAESEIQLPCFEPIRREGEQA